MQGDARPRVQGTRQERVERSAFPGGAGAGCHTHRLLAEGPGLGGTGARLLEPQSKLPRCSVFAGAAVYPLASSAVAVVPGGVGSRTVAAC